MYRSHVTEDPEPCERIPAGLLFVPVRSGPMGCTARIFRTPLGGRTAVGFTTQQQLIATLGDDQQWVRLAEPALRALTAPLGVTALTIDPQFTAPAASSAAFPTAPVSADTSGSWHSWDPQSVGVLRVAGIAAVVSCVNLLIG